MKVHMCYGSTLLRIACVIIVAGCFFALPARTAGAAIIDVPGDYVTIQAAIDAAAAGDTINVAAGEYTESVDLPAYSLNFVGAGGGGTLWNADAGPCIRSTDATFRNTPLIAFEISGFTFSSGDVQSILIMEAYRFEVTDFRLKIYDNTFSTTAEDKYALKLPKISGNERDPESGESPVRIYNNTFNSLNGIIMSNSDNFDIFDNDFTYDAPGKGNAIVQLNGCSSFCLSRGGHHIWGNVFAHYNDSPILLFYWMWEASPAGVTYLANTIEGNTFSGNTEAAAVKYSCWEDLEGGGMSYPGDVLRLNSFDGSNGAGVVVAGDYASQMMVDAANNYWGAADGPGPVGPGSGDAVSDYVIFDPFWRAPYPISIAMTPSSATIYPQATQQYAMTGTLLDGTTADVIAECAFTSGSPAIATVGAASGLATAVAPGSATINASCFAGAFLESATLNVATPDQPIANAGADRSIAVGASTTLDGSASSDPGGLPLTYLWSENASNPATGLIANPTAVSNIITPTVAGTYIFSLVVNNSFESSSTASVTVTVADLEAPVANAGPNLDGFAGASFVLDGSGSSDPASRALTYLWTEAAANPELGLIADPSQTQVTIEPRYAGTYEFSLVVNNGMKNSVSDAAKVYIANIAYEQRVSATSGGSIIVSDPSGALDGMRIIIPAGALPDDTDIMVGMLANPPEIPDEMGTSAGVAVIFGPSGLQFSTPVTIYVPFDESGFLFGVEYVIYVFNDALRQWETIPATMINGPPNYLAAEVTHFSIYQAGIQEQQATGGCAIAPTAGGSSGSMTMLMLLLGSAGLGMAVRRRRHSR